MSQDLADKIIGREDLKKKQGLHVIFPTSSEFGFPEMRDKLRLNYGRM